MKTKYKKTTDDSRDAGVTQSRTFKFWLEYLEMVALLLNFIEAERDSNWNCHIECFKTMLPYDRIFDDKKYFQWVLLPQYAPEVDLAFLDGKHVVSRSEENSHLRVKNELSLSWKLLRK